MAALDIVKLNYCLEKSDIAFKNLPIKFGFVEITDVHVIGSIEILPNAENACNRFKFKCNVDVNFYDQFGEIRRSHCFKNVDNTAIPSLLTTLDYVVNSWWKDVNPWDILLMNRFIDGLDLDSDWAEQFYIYKSPAVAVDGDYYCHIYYPQLDYVFYVFDNMQFKVSIVWQQRHAYNYKHKDRIDGHIGCLNMPYKSFNKEYFIMRGEKPDDRKEAPEDSGSSSFPFPDEAYGSGLTEADYYDAFEEVAPDNYYLQGGDDCDYDDYYEDYGFDEEVKKKVTITADFTYPVKDESLLCYKEGRLLIAFISDCIEKWFSGVEVRHIKDMIYTFTYFIDDSDYNELQNEIEKDVFAARERDDFTRSCIYGLYGVDIENDKLIRDESGNFILKEVLNTDSSKIISRLKAKYFLQHGDSEEFVFNQLFRKDFIGYKTATLKGVINH